jgi:hypothetical protein
MSALYLSNVLQLSLDIYTFHKMVAINNAYVCMYGLLEDNDGGNIEKRTCQGSRIEQLL